MQVQIRLKVWISLLMSLSTSSTHAQGTRGNDTTYYVFFPGSITARLYSSQKYVSFLLQNKNNRYLNYRPTTSLNFGIGATYHNFSINLAYGFGLFKNEDKGKTKYLDLQAHMYDPRWATDFYGQIYKGYSVESENLSRAGGPGYYYRPDIRVNLFGLARYRIFNPNRFSYRAAFLQNEWQKKSAGTFLLGAEVYYGVIKGDSSIVPKAVEGNYSPSGISKINYMNIGPGVGYAYTLVMLRHMFITGSLTGNLNFRNTTEYKGSLKQNHFSVNPSLQFRVAAGYNGKVWNVSANWVENDLPFRGKEGQSKYLLRTGNYRFVVARRFMPGKKLQRSLRLADKLFKE